MTKRFYITTAIDYLNGEPHLGHAYEKVVTDVIARARRSLGEDVFFLTGLDEHGQKVQQAASENGKQPQEYCDGLAMVWREFAKKLNLSNDDFIRTSEPRHKEVVQAILTKLHLAGHFYKAQYRGFYSLKEETFLTDKDRRPDGTFDPAYGEVTELVEDNYYFKLRAEQRWLIDHLESNPDFVQPASRRNEVLGFLKNHELEDLCITRPLARLNWGVPLPFDSHFVTYVWFDALVNYISVPAAHADPALGDGMGIKIRSANPEIKLWPADIHVIGKDILKFHAIYWPIMLKAMGLPLPKQLLVHGWWQKDGQKMSKTTGNIVDPVAVIDEWGVDAFRYYVVRELDIGPDGNWTDASFQARYAAELANGLGNLINRSLSMLKRYRNGVVPDRFDEPEFCEFVISHVEGTKKSLLQSHLQDALECIWQIVTLANQYVDKTAPFKLAKDPAKTARLNQVLYTLAETCRILAVLLWPFIPTAAENIFTQLGLRHPPNLMSGLAWGGLTSGHPIGVPAPLFPRRDLVKT